MCGRYSVRSNPARIVQVFRLPAASQLPPLTARYNVAPTDPVPAVRLKEAERRLEVFHWGLIPYFVNIPKRKPINARAETVASSPFFRSAFKKRRCLIVADGFYEWLRKGKKRLPFHYSLRDTDLFAFAGIWERWKDSEGEWTRSCAIVTTQANDLVAEIHDRMPVILPADAYEAWLDPETPLETVQGLLQPFPPEAMQAVPVSTRVNNVRNDDPGCLELRAVAP